MNLTALQTAVRTRLGIPTTDALFTDSNLKDLINAALHEIEAAYDWPWLEVVETINFTTESDPVSADYLRTIYLQQSDYPELERVDIAKLRAFPSTPGPRPTMYAFEAGSIIVRPVPTSAPVRHLYIKQESDLSVGADTPLMPATYHSAIVELAAHLGFRRAGQLAEADKARADYEVWLQRMLERHSKESSSEGGGTEPKK